MLSSLHIENIAVIKNLDIDLSAGFSVLTGETGAGKSIIIDAINAVLKHYEGYIAALATRRLYDENGVPHLCIDEEKRKM